MSTPNHKPRSRRTRYQKFSDKVFSLTGMPVWRVATIIVFLVGLGWALQYALRGEEQTAVQKTKLEKKEDFLQAITIPERFFEFAFPIQIEKLDAKIGRCDQLLNQGSEYSDQIQEKRLALLSLKVMTVAKNGIDPTETLDQFLNSLDQVSGALEQQDQYQYLLVSTYLKVLAADPDSDFYAPTEAAISAINETTPVPQLQATSCYQTAMKYYEDSNDRDKAGKLLQLLGEKMSMAEEPEVAYHGISLVDFPNFYEVYHGAISTALSADSWKAETNKLLNQLEKTPPRSLKTLSVLMNVPEKHLHAGNQEVALTVLQELQSAASASDARTRDDMLPKMQRLKTRIELFRNTFPLSGLDLAGRTIGPPEKEQTMIIFFNPNSKRSVNALRRLAGSPLREGWSTTTYLASVFELQEEDISVLRKLDPNFTIVDGPTAKDWFEKCGIEQVPYSIRLDEAGVVQRMGFP